MTKVKVLFLAADPLSADPSQPAESQQPRLKIDEEMREISAKVRAAEHRDALDFSARWAVRADDLLQALNEVRPQIVHFSGHGSKTGEIIVVGKDGTPRSISSGALLGLFRTLKDQIRVVLFNACYTQSQAEGIVEVIDCAIGMGRVVSDDAATTFAASFYRALGFGRSVREAFDQGTTALQLEGIPEDDTPRLLVREGVDPGEIVLVNPSEASSPAADRAMESKRIVHAENGGIAIGGSVHGSSITIGGGHNP